MRNVSKQNQVLNRKRKIVDMDFANFEDSDDLDVPIFIRNKNKKKDDESDDSSELFGGSNEVD